MVYRGVISDRESHNFLHLTPQQVAWCNKHIDGEWKVNEKGEIYTPDGHDFSNCPKINPKEVELSKDDKLFKIWLNAGTPPINEFLDPKSRWRGVVTGTKFGI